MMNLMLEKLNDEQRAAVTTTEGPVLVLAGAGTGKTRILTTRVAYILNNGRALPWQILALTFTNKAANEMKSRIEALAENGTGWDVRDLWCGTFHSICLRILRANATEAGLRNDFVIIDEDDQKRIIKNIPSLDIKSEEESVSALIEKISLIKDNGLEALQNTDKTYVAYNAELARMGAVDFGDIILRVLQLFKLHPEILSRYQHKFKYIMVDEFQDTNTAQMQLLEMLTADSDFPNICCVGDDDQSIYSWRGANINNILDFEKKFPNAKKIVDVNYRSTGNILNTANSLIQHNTNRLGKNLRPVDENNIGQPVYVLTLPTDKDEARLIADTIQREAGVTKRYSDYAILIRSSNQSRLLEEALNDRLIPYRLIGATKFYDRAEIRDVIAYLRLLVTPFDDMAFLRVIAKPRRGFGPAAIDKLRGAGQNLMDGLRLAKLNAKQREIADEFLNAFNFNWMDVPPQNAAQILLENTGYLNMWRDSVDENAEDRLENIQDLIDNIIVKYDTLPEFLENAALMTVEDDASNKSNDDKSAVNLMTIHAAKGLEFDTVFLPAWEEGIFPSEKAIYKLVDGKKVLDEQSLEEERRLAYVAITRAKKRCVISNCYSRWFYDESKSNSESRFIGEMNPQYLDFQGGAPRAHSASYRTTPRKPILRTEPKTLVGKLVSHVELGHGTVIAENGDVLTVAFGKHGMKNVMKSFVDVL